MFLTLVYMALLAMGFQASFIFVLAYVWVDIFTPQQIAFSLISSVPVSLILGLCVFVSFFRLPKDAYVKARAVTWITLLFGFWMTLTLFWAAVPGPALGKWDWAFKSVMFSALVPFFLRTRVHIEAMLWTLVISGIAHCIPFGFKVLISGGGYGKPLGLILSNHGLGEGSTLALISVCLVPMCLYLYKHQTLVPYKRAAKVMLGGFIALAVLTSIGTYARTGLIALGLLSALLIMRSKSKFTYLMVVAIGVAIVASIASDQWISRMETIGDDTEGSAMGRVAVWLWTLDYVATHPWGGSFEVYRINVSKMLLADGSTLEVTGKAFHSIYFEVLGETGVPGIICFLLLALLTRNAFARVSKRIAPPGEEWIQDAARYLLFTLYVFMAGGAFVGIGFQSFFYYLVAFGMAMTNLSNRMQAR
ncbi:DUF5935 domain-containing protein [Hydrogenophaga sp.]|uniref:DUF5935 domain-containing protein n=1 Tax=Hydrogenophaga sp. TaxID=1904254 RepID=UPI0025BE1176|nr:DUF5935 domain-containing protein [Hydrogenophaga sp.]